MKKLKSSRAYCAIISGILGFAASTATSYAAAIVVPPDLSPGDSYRIIYVTSTTRDATTPDISVYNAFVTADAAGVPALASLGTSWSAVASINNGVTARDNTGTNPTIPNPVPFYGLDGSRLADDNVALWSSGIVARVTNQDGIGVSGWVNTGTRADGTVLGGGLGFLGLGMDRGQASSTGTDWVWLDIGGADESIARPFYAVSGLLTVPVPEPSAALLSIVAFAGIALRRRRK